MLKIAINAGHYKTHGASVFQRQSTKNQTREWALNSRVVERVIEGLKAYTGYEVLRIDDPTGKKDLSLKKRTDKANKWGADIYISVHHNAAGSKNIFSKRHSGLYVVYPGAAETHNCKRLYTIV